MEHRAGLILDMDGVLFDSEPVHARSWERVVAPLGLRLEADWFVPWIGIPDTRVADLFEAAISGVTSEELLDRKREQYVRLSDEELVLFPGLLNAVETIKGLGVAVGVATSSTRADATRLLERLGMLPLLDALVCMEDVEREKARPDPYLLAAARLGVPPADCVVVEDSPVGIESGRAAGCRVYAVSTSFPAHALSAAKRIFTATAEALGEIFGLDPGV